MASPFDCCSVSFPRRSVRAWLLKIWCWFCMGKDLVQELSEICTAFLNKRTWINKLRLFERTFTRYYRNRNRLLCVSLSPGPQQLPSCFANQTHSLALFLFIVCGELQITSFFFRLSNFYLKPLLSSHVPAEAMLFVQRFSQLSFLLSRSKLTETTKNSLLVEKRKEKSLFMGMYYQSL